MKKSLFLFLMACLLFSSSGKTQEFSTEIFVSDTLGNVDTLIIGYDSLATTGIDEQFGEIDIMHQPIGDFDIRLVQFDKVDHCFIDEAERVYSLQHTKKDIVFRDCMTDYRYSTIPYQTLLIPNRNLPIKVEWNISDFQTECLSKSFATGYNVRDPAPPCVGQFERVLSLQHIDILEPEGVQYTDIEGEEYSLFSICLLREGDTLSSINENLDKNNHSVYPNPFDGFFYVNGIKEGTAYSIYNINGSLMEQGKLIGNKIMINKKGTLLIMFENGISKMILSK